MAGRGAREGAEWRSGRSAAQMRHARFPTQSLKPLATRLAHRQIRGLPCRFITPKAHSGSGTPSTGQQSGHLWSLMPGNGRECPRVARASPSELPGGWHGQPPAAVVASRARLGHVKARRGPHQRRTVRPPAAASAGTPGGTVRPAPAPSRSPGQHQQRPGAKGRPHFHVGAAIFSPTLRA